jgi:hypothetical protein
MAAIMAWRKRRKASAAAANNEKAAKNGAVKQWAA